MLPIRTATIAHANAATTRIVGESWCLASDSMRVLSGAATPFFPMPIMPIPTQPQFMDSAHPGLGYSKRAVATTNPATSPFASAR